MLHGDSYKTPRIVSPKASVVLSILGILAIVAPGCRRTSERVVTVQPCPTSAPVTMLLPKRTPPKANTVQSPGVEPEQLQAPIAGPATTIADTQTATISAAAVEDDMDDSPAPPRELNLRGTPVSLDAILSSSRPTPAFSAANLGADMPATLGPQVRMPLLEKAGMADELVALNFEQTDIRDVLKTIGDITGINFVLDEQVKGTVTLMFPSEIRLADVYRVLESVLEINGFAAVPAGDLVKIVPRTEAIKHNLGVRFGSDPSQIPLTDSVVTQIIPLAYADAGEISRVIQPLLASNSQMAIYARTNSIVITDTSSNIHHIATVIQQLDVEGSKDEVTVLRLEYASAQVLAEHIRSILQKSREISRPIARPQAAAQSETGPKILADSRTNSLIISASTQDTQMIAALVEQLDVRRPAGSNNVHVVPLKHAQAKDVAEPLTAALDSLRITDQLNTTQQVQVTADPGTNALIIVAAPQDFEVIKEIVDKLDIVREQILVEMLIVEVSEDAMRELGIDWATIDDVVSGSMRAFAATNLGPRVEFLNGDLEGLAVGGWRASGSDVRIGAILKALERHSGVNILSTPHLLTSNHTKAMMLVSENRAFLKQARITETVDFLTPTVIKDFEYRDVGITLEITPHVSQGGLIRLEIDSEFSKILEDATSPSPDTLTTARRQIQTVVVMNNGSTVVIGGLIRDDRVKVEKKIPFVGSLPVVGALFKTQRESVQKTNLFLFITPRVLTTQQQLDQVTTQKKQQMDAVLRDKSKGKNNQQ